MILESPHLPLHLPETDSSLSPPKKFGPTEAPERKPDGLELTAKTPENW